MGPDDGLARRATDREALDWCIERLRYIIPILDQHAKWLNEMGVDTLNPAQRSMLGPMAVDRQIHIRTTSSLTRKAKIALGITASLAWLLTPLATAVIIKIIH